MKPSITTEDLGRYLAHDLIIRARGLDVSQIQDELSTIFYRQLARYNEENPMPERVAAAQCLSGFLAALAPTLYMGVRHG